MHPKSGEHAAMRHKWQFMKLKSCGHVHNGNSEKTMTDEVVLDGDVATPPAESSDELTPEEMLPKSRVEELVKKAKLKGRDGMQAELDAIRAENEALKKQQGSMGGMAVPVDAEAIRQQVMADLKAEFQQHSEARAAADLDNEAKRIAGEYHAKMKTGRDKYEDFDEIMADFNPQAFPNLVYLANQLDNTPDVMRELMQNPQKWSTVAVLSERDPEAAQKYLGRISQSIKTNELAKAQEKDVAPPLSRLSSSTTGQDTGKPSSMADMKRMFRG